MTCSIDVNNNNNWKQVKSAIYPTKKYKTKQISQVQSLPFAEVQNKMLPKSEFEHRNFVNFINIQIIRIPLFDSPDVIQLNTNAQ